MWKPVLANKPLRLFLDHAQTVVTSSRSGRTGFQPSTDHRLDGRANHNIGICKSVRTYPMHHAAGCGLTLRGIDGSFMKSTKICPGRPVPSTKRSFAAMCHEGFRAWFITFVLAMTTDTIEHVISYWMLYQKFHSPALAGFATVSYWLPFLLFSVPSARSRTASTRAASC
jgi:hypothetical protein